ncbi:endolytic transglycosylase MltG [Blastococcus goldschmidtiae]|uniref:Endolytic murein transglycosylase n=1 Tax=Blastococcus goldschmidtiae TaxID=3075546 RepID=A0ABU2K9X5_9ACTN|nr:endolytic transglycosylase MltG [Blastococcus sp. DSM 46792]MDT0276996.1 endolytic transglycosylase MltG [Blastococcus sp. DSM 46792]
MPDRRDRHTGPLPEPAWWSYDHPDHPDHPRARQGGGDDVPAASGGPGDAQRPEPQRPGSQHPSGPLPPMPSGVWDRLQPRADRPADDDATVAAHPIGPAADDEAHDDEHHPAEGDTESWDRTGGLDVIGAHVEDDAPRRRRWGRRSRGDDAGGGTPDAGRTPGPDDEHILDEPVHDEHIDDEDVHAASVDAGTDDHLGLDDTGRLEEMEHPDDHGGAIPLVPYDRRGGRSRRRRPLAVLLSLLVLGGLVVGIVLGVQALLGLTAAEDYTGEGSGTVEVRVQQGDTLSEIARTLADEGVIASTQPFVEAAEGRPEATGIQPGVYELRSQMSGSAALDRLLESDSRLLSRVTIPEGLTVAQILERVATETGRPLEELRAAAADVDALGLPPYANGQLEGYLFPATYDLDPDDTPADILRRMVQQFTSVAGTLRLEERAAALGRTPAEIVTIASMIQSETRLDEERPDVAQVIYNRLEQGVRLGIDATLAYGLGKSGNELTVSDLRSDNPYNTRTQDGLPPTPISSPGEASLEAALEPSSGDLLYYVLESADGNHFFTADYDEFLAARQRCAEAGLGCGG